MLLLTGRKKKTAAVDRIFLGIGNPGRQYETSRHNIGFMAIDRIERDFTIIARKHTETADYRIGSQGGRVCAFIKPLTYVNNSGTALIQALTEMSCPLEACLVVVDDYHLPLGMLRLRRSGSDGGHNGLKSIIEQVGTGFPRLRIGIGPLPDDVSAVDFVLGDFKKSESDVVAEVVEKANIVMSLFAQIDIDAAMSAINNTL